MPTQISSGKTLKDFISEDREHTVTKIKMEGDSDNMQKDNDDPFIFESCYLLQFHARSTQVQPIITDLSLHLSAISRRVVVS
ncbi:hypothetical protein L1987_79357 [Smallanthus sonchifolius]|uniref:Uncharacterized protein n=2 Tax=Smallanthus sonchifolius TaxID=185202 RepID=A0ACB8ZFF6_9ASTR|nr:hypothetical protein L1987_79353 [Smallanthus sonchifolius]KAI3696343.1 hypothetical protein L1987_79357 [Smallanthus sonchifolius]